MSEEETREDSRVEAPIAGIGTMVFGKWDATEVTCSDPGLAPYINLTTIGTPHSGSILDYKKLNFNHKCNILTSKMCLFLLLFYWYYMFFTDILLIDFF